MKHWVDKLRQSFRRAGKTPAAAQTSAPAAGVPPAAPPAPARIAPQQLYKDFAEHIAPLLDKLQKYPADEKGMEFFIRADVVNDMHGQPKDQRIDVWMFYTRDIYRRQRPAGGMPHSHFIQMARKDSTPENPRYDVCLEQSLRPVLRLSIHPYAPGQQIEAYQYIEYFEPPQEGKEYNVYIGGDGLVMDKQGQKHLAAVADFAGEVQGWISAVAGARAPQILQDTGLISAELTRTVAVGKPLRLKKKAPEA